MANARCVIKASGASQPVTTTQAAVAAPAPEQIAQVSPAPQDYWAPLGGGDSARK